MRSYSVSGWALIALSGLTLWTGSGNVHAEDPGGSPVLESILNNAPQEKKDVPRVPEPSGPPTPRERLSIGVNYTGGQVRWRLSTRWAAEGRMQFGSADSNYGKVHSQIFGLRGYRFFPFRERMTWYAGGEAAYVKADTDSSSYNTSGFAFGTFGGLEYRVLPRVSVGVDIGPYVISLKEKQTGLTSTGLDFVINTALNFYLF